MLWFGVEAPCYGPRQSWPGDCRRIIVHCSRSDRKQVMPSIELRTIVVLALLLSPPTPAAAKSFSEMFPNVTVTQEKAREFVESLDYRQGTVALGVGGVQLNVGPDFYFLGSGDARRVITDAWANPPATAQNVLGMIFPSGRTPVDDTWGAVVTFNEEGYVSDEDAAQINYSELLTAMQEATAKVNEERTKQGYPAIRLVGWASPPFYDNASHKLHWARELEFSDSPDRTLNYDVRALGRKGVLNMNFVAGMNQLAEIRQVIPAVIGMPEFQEGSRYEDYVPGMDKVAAYGIGGLIAGKLLSKAGFFAILLAFLKKGWIVFVLLGAAAIGGLRRLFGRRTQPPAQ